MTAHTKELSALKTVATAQGVALTATLNPSQKADVAKLQKLSGAKLGAQFTKLEYDDHSSEIADHGDRYSAPGTSEHASLADGAYRTITGSRP